MDTLCHIGDISIYSYFIEVCQMLFQLWKQSFNSSAVQYSLMCFSILFASISFWIFPVVFIRDIYLKLSSSFGISVTLAL